jgi:hypothetical protein
MRNRLAVCFAFALGIALGAALSQPRGVRADATVIVRRVELQTNQSRVVVAGDVVGLATLRHRNTTTDRHNASLGRGCTHHLV